MLPARANFFALESIQRVILLNTVEAFFRRHGHWPDILGLGLFAAFLLAVLSEMGGAAAPAFALDTRLSYTTAEAQAVLGRLSLAQRALAARAHLTVDVLFPLAYGLLLALLLVRAWPRRRLWLLAPAIVLADLTENALLAFLYLRYPVGLNTLTPWASAATMLKWGLMGVAVAAVVWGWGERLAKRKTPQ